MLAKRLGLMILSDVWFVPGFFGSPTKATFHKICGLVLKMIRVSDFMAEASVLLEFRGLFLQIQDQ